MPRRLVVTSSWEIIRVRRIKKDSHSNKENKKKVGKVYLGCYSYKQSVRGARGGKCLPSLVALAHMLGGRDA